MIRDPSDGSVREKPVIETTTSGLPEASQKSSYQVRLEASRSWLKEYHASKNPEKVVRDMGEQ